MNLKKFKDLYRQFNQFPLSKQELESPEYEKYIEAIYSNKNFNDWYLKQKILEAGINYKDFCCILMAYNLIEDKLRNTENNLDRIITYDKKNKNFGIPIHDGGYSYQKIDYCPWCGKALFNYPTNK